jgi:hypothetical protein
MPSQTSLPQNFHLVQLASPKTTSAGFTTGYITLKDAVKAWIVAELTDAVGFAEVFSVLQAQDVSGTNSAAGPTGKVWANEDTGTSDTQVRQTDGNSYTTTNNIKNKEVIFEIDPAALTDGFTTVALQVSASSQATNFVSVTAILERRYPSQPSTQESAQAN